ncbi:MAG TPA: tetratricopeptide repeat protein [Longimicrobiales bacterium]
MRWAGLALVAWLALPPFGTGDVERGNRLYREGRYAEAVEAYRAALASGRASPELHYNLGTALLQLGRYAEAERHLREAVRAADPELRHRAYYNLGNRYLLEARDGKPDEEARTRLLDEAVDAYKEALRLRPGDQDAKWNLELALRDREEQPQGSSGPSTQGQQGEQGGGGGGQQQATPPPRGGGGGGADYPDGYDAPPPMSREEAERILRATGQDERELFRSRLRRAGQRETPVLRDW